MTVLTIIIIILSLVVIIAAEIWYDHYRWRNNLDDKPSSTIMRVAAFLLFGVMCWLLGVSGFLAATFLAFASHLFFFDNTLNVIRFKRIKSMGYNFWQTLYYHSGRGTDLIYKGIPPYAETFFKGIILGISIHFF